MDVEGAAEPMVIAEKEDEVQGMSLMGQENRTVPPYRWLRLGLGLSLASGLLVLLVGRQSSTIRGSIERHPRSAALWEKEDFTDPNKCAAVKESCESKPCCEATGRFAAETYCSVFKGYCRDYSETVAGADDNCYDYDCSY